MVWGDQPVDVIDSPDVGRVGPVPYFRTGGHRAGGFAIFKGPGVEPGSTLPTAEVVDMPPTILSLLGAAVPEHFEGRPIPVTAASVAANRSPAVRIPSAASG